MKPLSRSLPMVLLALILVACPKDSPPNGADSDFELNISPAVVTVSGAGATATATLTIERINGFDGDVIFQVKQAPSELEAILQDVTENSAEVQITGQEEIVAGNYTITLQASAEGKVRTANLKVDVITGSMTKELASISIEGIPESRAATLVIDYSEDEQRLITFNGNETKQIEITQGVYQVHAPDIRDGKDRYVPELGTYVLEVGNEQTNTLNIAYVVREGEPLSPLVEDKLIETNDGVIVELSTLVNVEATAFTSEGDGENGPYTVHVILDGPISSLDQADADDAIAIQLPIDEAIDGESISLQKRGAGDVIGGFFRTIKVYSKEALDDVVDGVAKVADTTVHVALSAAYVGTYLDLTGSARRDVRAVRSDYQTLSKEMQRMQEDEEIAEVLKRVEAGDAFVEITYEFIDDQFLDRFRPPTVGLYRYDMDQLPSPEQTTVTNKSILYMRGESICSSDIEERLLGQPVSNPVANNRTAIVTIHGWQTLGSIKAFTEGDRAFLNPHCKAWIRLVSQMKDTSDPTLKQLRDEVDWYTFRYDSDNRIETSGELLAQELERLQGYENVILLAHSMGGLVSIEADARLVNNNIGGIITLATPFMGGALGCSVVGEFHCLGSFSLPGLLTTVWAPQDIEGTLDLTTYYHAQYNLLMSGELLKFGQALGNPYLERLWEDEAKLHKVYPLVAVDMLDVISQLRGWSYSDGAVPLASALGLRSFYQPEVSLDNLGNDFPYNQNFYARPIMFKNYGHGEIVHGKAQNGRKAYEDTALFNTIAETLKLFVDNPVTPTLPVAVLNASPDSGNAPLTVSFNTQGSTTGESVRYNLKFGDNTDDETNTTGQFTHTYSAAGTYTAELRVSDAQGLVSEKASVTIMVSEGTVGNQAPSAVMRVSPLSGTPPFEVTLNAEESSDPDQDALSYTWTLDSKPASSNATITNANAVQASFRADAPGSYSVRLTVSDGTASDTQTRTVTASEGGETCSGSYTIDGNDTSADIATVAKCNVIVENLIIYNTNLTNLSGLENLTSVLGSLTIHHNGALESLTGLDNLSNVGQNLVIYYNNKLLTLQGLHSLSKVAGTLNLGSNGHYPGNNSLIDISALANLREVRNLSMRNMPVLSLEGLEGLEKIKGDMRLVNLHKLMNLEGLDNLTEVNTLQVSSMDSLENMQGLGQLSKVGGDLILTNNDRLQDFAELASLAQVEGKLQVVAHAELESLSGLDSIRQVNELVISDNDALRDLEGLNGLEIVSGDVAITLSKDLETISALAKLTTIDGVLSIRDNSSLESLVGLEGIQAVKGLWIENNSTLASLAGLDNLETIGDSRAGDGDYLRIINNASLTDLQGLSKLSSVRSHVIIRDNRLLETLNGLESLTRIGGTLDIINNELLENVAGLNALTQVRGNVVIYSNNSLQNLDGFQQLERINGTLRIGNYINYNYRGNGSLTSIAGLSNLSRVKHVYVTGNPALRSLQGLEKLTSLETLIIVENNGLTSLAGLDNLSRVVGGQVRIENNPSLANLDNLSSLATVVGDLQIISNNTLDHIQGLSKLQNVQGTLVIESNPELPNLEGLEGLDSFGGSIKVSNNVVLASLKGLDNLTTMTGGLRIDNNPALLSIANLGNLTTVSGSLHIENNPFLSTLGGQSSGLHALQTIGGTLTIRNNAKLVNLSGLGALTSVSNTLQVDNNDAMTSLQGLDVFSSIGSHLYIEGNPVLTDISALSTVNSVGGQYTYIKQNAMFDCTPYNAQPYSLRFFPVYASSGNKVDCVTQ